MGKKKAQGLERLNKQLSRLVTVRPQFMDEYEKLERELERLYDQYLERFRNLDYLEHELDLLNKAEQNKMEENERALKRMQKRLHEAEWRLLRGEQEGDGDELMDNSKRTKNGQKRSQSRQKMHNEAKSNGAVMYGSMNAPDDSEPGGDDTDLTDEIVSDSEPPISMGGSSDEDILEESSDESDEELAVGTGGAAAGRGK